MKEALYERAGGAWVLHSPPLLSPPSSPLPPPHPGHARPPRCSTAIALSSGSFTAGPSGSSIQALEPAGCLRSAVRPSRSSCRRRSLSTICAAAARQQRGAAGAEGQGGRAGPARWPSDGASFDPHAPRRKLPHAAALVAVAVEAPVAAPLGAGRRLTWARTSRNSSPSRSVSATASRSLFIVATASTGPVVRWLQQKRWCSQQARFCRRQGQRPRPRSGILSCLVVLPWLVPPALARIAPSPAALRAYGRLAVEASHCCNWP
jgi:hypothetical protein